MKGCSQGKRKAMFIDVMIAKAKADRKTIVLPEGNDERVLGGAEKALAAGSFLRCLPSLFA